MDKWRIIELAIGGIFSVAWYHLITLVSSVKKSVESALQKAENLKDAMHKQELERMEKHPTKAEHKEDLERVWGANSVTESKANSAHRRLDDHIINHHINSHDEGEGSA